MNESQEHLDPKEATEAKLCAYLEGELPASERADIEQHLTANPQHRKLLADLAKTRQWMRAIPRQSAPTDLAESFQGQVERSMLLDGSASSPLSKVRWPQVLMLAAIVVLTLGLAGTLIYMLRPLSHSFSVGPSVAPPPATSPAVAGTAENKLDGKLNAPGTVAVVAAPPAAAPVSLAAPIAAPPAEPLAGGAGFDKDRVALRSVAGAEVEKDELNAEGMKTELQLLGYRPPGDTRSVCFVIHSNDPAATASQVQDFFARHQLLSETPLNLAAVPPSRHVTGRVTMTAQQLQDAAVQSPRNGANPAAPATQAQNQMLQGQGGQAQNLGAASLNNVNSSANNSPAQGQQEKSIAPSVAAANNNAAELQSQQVQDKLPGDLFYVAHGVTPLQVALLNASLAANNPTQTVRQIMLSEGAEKKLSPPAGAIVKDQLLTVTVAQLVGPGIDKTNLVKVGDDGNISLPMIDPLPAAGATAEELQQRIAAKYREANLIPDATVSVLMPPSTQPTTAPATQPMMEVAKAVAATQPGAADATTQPVAHEQGIDVVVVIEKAR